jgi:formamidopyrimidine-DNA glycosylase
MPELPEVETVRRGLEKIFATNNVIESVELRRPNLRETIPANLPTLLREKKVVSVRRRAKYLLLDTETETVISHLGMSGTWRVAPPGQEALHDHVYLNLKNGPRLAFNDPRRFGILDVAPKGQVFDNKWLKHLGLEPFDDAFTAEFMQRAARGRSAPVKNFIMDQKIVVGVGNIYAVEALFLAGIRPQRQAHRVQLTEWATLIKHIRAILLRSIEKGGTTLSDHRQVEGGSGAFQNQLRVYGRQGEPCRKCKKPVKMKTLAGRSTFWCAHCQK